MFASAGSRGGRSRTQRSPSDPFHWDPVGNTLDLNGGWTAIVPMSSGPTYTVSLGSSVTGTGNYVSNGARLIFGSDFSIAWSPNFVSATIANAAGTASVNLVGGLFTGSAFSAGNSVTTSEIELGGAVWRGSNQAVTLTTSNSGICWSPPSLGSTPDTGLVRASTHVVAFSDGLSVNHNGWMNWAGQQRVLSDFSLSTNTLTNVTGISSVPLMGGRAYGFDAWLSCTCGAAAGGVKFAITCTSTTITSLLVDCATINGSSVTQSIATSTNTAIGGVTTATSTPVARISGLIRPGSSGLFGIQFAQNATNATASVVSSGSWLMVYDMP